MRAAQESNQANRRLSSISLQSHPPAARHTKVSDQEIYAFVKKITPAFFKRVEQFMREHMKKNMFPFKVRKNYDPGAIYEDIYTIYCIKIFEDNLETSEGLAKVLEMIGKDIKRSEATIRERITKKISKLSLQTIYKCMDEQRDLPSKQNGLVVPDGPSWQEKCLARQKEKMERIRNANQCDGKQSEGFWQVQNSLNKARKHVKNVQQKKSSSMSELIKHFQNKIRQIQENGLGKNVSSQEPIVIEEDKPAEDKQKKRNETPALQNLIPTEKPINTFVYDQSKVTPFITNLQAPQKEKLKPADNALGLVPLPWEAPKVDPKKDIKFVYRQSTKEFFPISQLSIDFQFQLLRQESNKAIQRINKINSSFFQWESAMQAKQKEAAAAIKAKRDADKEKEKRAFEKYVEFLDQLQKSILNVEPNMENLSLLLSLHKAIDKMRDCCRSNYEQFRNQMSIVSKSQSQSQSSEPKTVSQQTASIYSQNRAYAEVLNKSSSASKIKEQSRKSSDSGGEWSEVEDRLLADYLLNPVEFELEFNCLRRYKSVDQILARIQHIKIALPDLQRLA